MTVAAKKRARKSYELPNEVFCEMWERSEDMNVFMETAWAYADKKGLPRMPRDTAQVRAAILRRQGVPLKKMPRKSGGRNRIDVAGLSDLIHRIRSGEKTTPPKKAARIKTIRELLHG